MITQESITQILKKVVYPGFEKSIVDYGFVKNVAIEGNKVGIRIEIPSSSPEVAADLRQSVLSELSQNSVNEVNLEIKQPENSAKPKSVSPQGKNLAPHIKSFLMVSSGKGGVGKTTTSVNLAIAAAMRGKKVGILDADIYGPNVPRMMGLTDVEPKQENNKLIPMEAYGIEVMSLGLIYKQGESLIWRGPMIMRAVEQLLRDVAWGELDLLVIDMPPGTGDAQLTLAQSVPVSAGLTVTTPQTVSLDDSSRSLDMFKKLKIPIAGIIENMSGFICPESGKEYAIFGKGTAQAMAREFGSEVLASVPIEIAIREGGDEGKPVVYHHPDSQSAKIYMAAIDEVLEKIEDFQKSGLVANESIQPVKNDKPACH